MPKLLIPLLAAFALPTAVNSETYSLMVIETSHVDNSGVFEEITNITFSTYEACFEEGKRFADRSKFWTGIAEAMAEQWGNL